MTLETVYSYGPYFLAFGVSLRIKSECGKYGPAYLDTFHAVVAFKTSSVTGIVAFDISKVFGQDTAYYGSSSQN